MHDHMGEEQDLVDHENLETNQWTKTHNEQFEDSPRKLNSTKYKSNAEKKSPNVHYEKKVSMVDDKTDKKIPRRIKEQ